MSLSVDLYYFYVNVIDGFVGNRQESVVQYQSEVYWIVLYKRMLKV